MSLRSRKTGNLTLVIGRWAFVIFGNRNRVVWPRFASRVPVRTTDWSLIVTVRVPDMTAYAYEPSTFQNPISYARCSYVTPRSARHFSTSASHLAAALGFIQRYGAMPSIIWPGEFDQRPSNSSFFLMEEAWTHGDGTAGFD